jgi:hypothetical protein
VEIKIVAFSQGRHGHANEEGSEADTDDISKRTPCRVHVRVFLW